MGSRIQPLTSASTHFVTDPMRTKKLLLHKKELAKIFGLVSQKGYTCIALSLYWKKHLVKCDIALAKGKKEFDKRADIKEKENSIEMKRAFISSKKNKY